MRIGILTLPLHTNYGGILQAYALQQVLQGMGHEAIVIDEEKLFHFSLKRRIEMYVKGKVKRLLLGKNAIIYSPEYYKQLWTTRTLNTRQFISKHIVCRTVTSVSEIARNEFDAFIVGSDQIWRAHYAQPFPGIGNAFLLFTKGWNVKRISYAASFGIDEWEYCKSDTATCAMMAKAFDAISVREASGIMLCKKHLGIDAVHVIDPTLLLDADYYIRLIKDTSTKETGNLMCYILNGDKDTENIISDIANKEQLSPFHTNSRTEDQKATLEERIQPPVEEWLQGFCYAKFIVTDSYHACIFAILFKKPFIAIGNKNRGMARFNSLLQMLNLETRLISSYEDYEQKKATLLQPIDYDNVHHILAAKRNEAIRFIQQALASD